MSDSYILEVKPVMSANEGRKFENDMNARFRRVASKFGGALKDNVSKMRGTIAGTFTKAISGVKDKIGSILGGAVGGALAIAGTIMSNPIDKLNASIDSTLSKADNLATRAGQIGTTSGKLAQVEAVAKSAGVTNFDMIISRFQTELGKARTGESDTLKEFAGEKDTMDAFLQVIDSLKTLKPAEQNLMISKIFGERANLQLAEFMQADLIGRKKQIFGNTSQEQLTKAIDSLAGKEDLQAVLRQKNAVEDLLQKSRMITEGTIKLQTQYEKTQKMTENAQFGQYGNFAKMAIDMEAAKNSMAEIQGVVTGTLAEAGETTKKGWEWLKSKWRGGIFK